MKHLITLPVSAIAAIMVLASCTSTEDTPPAAPRLSSLNNTECLGFSPQSRSDNGYIGSFEMILDGSAARCKFTSLLYPCDFGKVNVSVDYSDGILTIVEYPSSDFADCLCETNASFTIEDIPQNDFVLKIYRGAASSGTYYEEYPMYTGKFSIREGALTIPYM